MGSSVATPLRKIKSRERAGTRTIGVGTYSALYISLEYSNICYKEKTLETTYDGEINYQENYVTNYWWNDNIYPNELKVVTPWVEYPDGMKRRFVREYEVTYSDELIDAILESDYETFERIIGTCSNEVIETITDINMKENCYHLEGELGTIDLDSSIRVPESKSMNALITNVEISFFISISILILKWRKFRLIKYVKEVNNYYNTQKSEYIVRKDEISRKIDIIDQKILSIKNRGGKNL